MSVALANSPSPDKDLLKDSLEFNYKNYIDSVAEILSEYDRFKVETQAGILDDETQGRATDFLKKINDTSSEIEKTRVDVKNPYLECERVVDEFFTKRLRSVIGATADLVKVKLSQYAAYRAQKAKEIAEQEAEKARKEAEILAGLALFDDDVAPAAAAAQQAVADAEKVASQPASLFSAVTGSGGATSRLRKVWRFQVTDKRLMLMEYLMPDESAIRRAISEGVRHIDGVRIYEEDTVSVR